MPTEKKIQLGFGITILTMIIILTLFYWNEDLSTINTYEVFFISLISFVVGLVSSIIVRFFKIRTNYNIMSLVILAFGFGLFCLGDFPLSVIPLSSYLVIILISFAIGTFLSLVIYFVI